MDRLQQVVAQGKNRSLNAIAHPQLIQNIAYVSLDRVGTHKQGRCDFRISIAFHNEPQNLNFSI